MLVEIDLERDFRAIQTISQSIDDIVAQVTEMRKKMEVRDRGFFMPDEDYATKQLFVTFRAHRNALFEIINRYRNYDDILESPQATKAFILGLSSALLLYNWSSYLVHLYKDVKPIRKKLNEGDPVAGIEPGLFDLIYRNLTRIENQSAIQQAVEDYESLKDQLINSLNGHPMSQLIDKIDHLSMFIQRGQWDIWTTRIKRDIDVIPRRVASPMKAASFKLKNWVFDLFGNIWLDHIPRIPFSHIDRFEEIMQPGDFFIVRPEQKSSTILIPGWWTHAAIYFGGHDKLKEAGALELPNIKAHLEQIKQQSQDDHNVIIEALSAGVVINPLSRTLSVDHAVAFRPRLSQEQLHEALNDLFSHVGKEYDFSFDLSRSDRLVCTEVLYRTLHGKGDISFMPMKRMGRVTISADDIIGQILNHMIDQNHIEVLAISIKSDDGSSEFLEGSEAVQKLQTTAIT